MSIRWGYSPKTEKYIPLADFPADRYLIVARQAIENLGWKLSHLSETGLIAYTPISLQSYSEEISIKIAANFAIVKSECVGIQMWFNDYGKNDVNLEKFFHEFEYIEYHLKDIWAESIDEFQRLVADQDPDYFEKAPLSAKNKIKTVLYLFYPQKGYFVTPILIWINVLYWFFSFVYVALTLRLHHGNGLIAETITNAYFSIGANNRELALSGELWRLISCQFIHFSFSHLFFNMYALVYIGLMVEPKLRSKNYLFVYITSGICASALSLVFHQEGILVGASGAIMGIFGSFLALLLSQAFEKNATRALLISTGIVTAIMLFNGLRGQVDNSAHVGGLISGFIITYILYSEQFSWLKNKLSLRYLLSFGYALVFCGLILILTPNYQIRAFKNLQFEFNRNAYDAALLYQIPPGLSSNEKVIYIQKYGIKPWSKNKEVVRKMYLLKLNQSESARRSFNDQITGRAYRISVLLLKESTENTTRYRNEMEKLTQEINLIKRMNKIHND